MRIKEAKTCLRVSNAEKFAEQGPWLQVIAPFV